VGIRLQDSVEAALPAFFVKARDPEHLPSIETSQLTSERTRCAAGLPVQSPLPAKTDLSKRLTRRQNQIVLPGSTNKQIARVLALTKGTVKSHLHRIHRTVGVSNRTQLTAQCFASQ
jgi:DNA-binding NarL/FixJ family response regulator